MADLKQVLAEHKQRHARQQYPFCEDFGCMDIQPLVAEIERLEADLKAARREGRGVPDGPAQPHG